MQNDRNICRIIFSELMYIPKVKRFYFDNIIIINFTRVEIEACSDLVICKFSLFFIINRIFMRFINLKNFYNVYHAD